MSDDITIPDEALREGVASDDARYRALKRKIMALILDTWDGVRLIDNAAEIAITLVMEEAAKLMNEMGAQKETSE